jgi:hypothetical protein
MRITLSPETNVFLARATQALQAYAARHKGTPKQVDSGSRIEEHGDGQFYAVLRSDGVVAGVYAITPDGAVRRTGDYPATILEA